MVDTSSMNAIVAKHAAGVQYYYYVTELCDTALNRVDLGVGKVEGTELWQMLVQVASGMQYLHSKHILHRDLKPGNVLVSETKIPLWMSLEVIVTDRAQLNAYPFASDVYAFAVLAWQVLSGKMPYVGSAECSGMHHHQIQQLVVGGLRPEVPQNAEQRKEWRWPEGVVELLELCWAERAEARPNFAGVVRDLHLMEGEFTHNPS